MKENRINEKIPGGEMRSSCRLNRRRLHSVCVCVCICITFGMCTNFKYIFFDAATCELGLSLSVFVCNVNR